MLEYFTYLYYYLSEWYGPDLESIQLAAEKVTRGIMVDQALKSVGLTRSHLEEIAEKMSSLGTIGVGFEISMHLSSLVVGFGTEYAIDRRKHFSFLKAFMYYGATYGFTSAVLQHRVINMALNSGDVALKYLL